jgi:pyrimidine operon attenuation protein/uracil phosphoribosyltransferase
MDTPDADQTLLTRMDLQQLFRHMADEIQTLEWPAHATGPLWLVGIHRGGVEIARELATVLAVGNKQPPPVGVLDPTLYRDDAWQKGPLAVEARTQLPGDIEGRRILLVDDVLYTGRTVRAALNVLMDFGRPAAVKLAVLLDRGGRELPVHAEVVGQQIVVAAQARVRLRYDASGRVQQVVVAGPAGD